ncbi:hypothetical protein GCM10009797_18180 [Nocardioides hwasunensis]
MHDAGVVPGLVRGEVVLLLEHDDLRAGSATDDLTRDRDAEDAPTDHADPLLPHRDDGGA